MLLAEPGVGEPRLLPEHAAATLSPTQAAWLLLGLRLGNMVESAETLIELLEEGGTTAVLCQSPAAVLGALQGGAQGLPAAVFGDGAEDSAAGRHLAAAFRYLPDDISLR